MKSRASIPGSTNCRRHSCESGFVRWIKNDQRRAIAARYTEGLRTLPGITTPVSVAGAVPVYHLYVIRSKQRDALAAYLNEHKIGCLVHYPTAPHMQAAYAELALALDSLPLARAAAAETLSLPMWPGMSKRKSTRSSTAYANSARSNEPMSLPVSVIVPIFNQGDYALRAIDSLCAQTYDNLQIIVVDDGSSDGSAKRVRQHFGAKITLLEQENAGPSAALNAGLRIAQGDIIALMGGDDIATQDRITHQAAILGTANWDVVFSSPSSSMRQAPRSGMGSIRFSSPRESNLLRSLFSTTTIFAPLPQPCGAA